MQCSHLSYKKAVAFTNWISVCLYMLSDLFMCEHACAALPAPPSWSPPRTVHICCGSSASTPRLRWLSADPGSHHLQSRHNLLGPYVPAVRCHRRTNFQNLGTGWIPYGTSTPSRGGGYFREQVTRERKWSCVCVH